ncbi:hypothetical protein HYV86_02685 [Candidatus Woesearchaeota archaeon]|nr:hypothetical protein [Candidatus Woesearchaeota archaeon]
MELMDQKESSKTKNKSTAVILVLLLVMGAIFFVRPSIIGYGIYKEIEQSNYTVDTYGKNLQELQHELQTIRTNATLYTSFNEQLLSQYEDIAQKYTLCTDERSQAVAQLKVSEDSCADKVALLEQQNANTKSLYEQSLRDKENQQNVIVDQKTTQLEQDKVQCTQEAQTAKQEKETVQRDFDAFAATMAKSVCCKEKVDNPQIDSFTISSNKIVCLVGGEKKIGC